MNYKERKEKLQSLVGATILGLQVDVNKECIKVVTDKGNYNFLAVGDCCSRSWIEHVEGVTRIIEGTILEVPELRPEGEVNEAESTFEKEFDSYGNLVQNYQTSFKTNKGSLNIEFRNSSNGYYGGWLELDGDQYGDPVDEHEAMIDLKEDF